MTNEEYKQLREQKRLQRIEEGKRKQQEWEEREAERLRDEEKCVQYAVKRMEEGVNQSQAARELGVVRATLNSWMVKRGIYISAFNKEKNEPAAPSSSSTDYKEIIDGAGKIVKSLKDLVGHSKNCKCEIEPAKGLDSGLAVKVSEDCKVPCEGYIFLKGNSVKAELLNDAIRLIQMYLEGK